MMRKLNINYLLGTLLLMFAIAGCKDKDFENYKIQSVDNHGSNLPIISTAVTASANEEFLAYAVTPVSDILEYELIPVVLNTNSGAPFDIHVKMVPALDSLDAYNTRNETAYIMPDGSTGPAFTLLDDGIVTIPKGKNVGYLKIKTATLDYFGDDVYAYAYKIESVQESGFVISGNHNFGIVAVLPKNQWDGAYTMNIKTSGWSAYGISDGNAADWGKINLATTGQFSLGFESVSGNAATGNAQMAFLAGETSKTAFGAATPIFTFDPTTQKLTGIVNKTPDGRNRAFKPNPDAPGTDNVFDEDKNITLNYIMSQDGRPDQYIVAKLTYKGDR